MSSFTNRLERDLGDIAAQAAPSPTGWAQIQQRIERQPDEPATEVVLMPLDQGPSVGQGPTTDRRGWLAAAVVLVIVAGVALVQSATDSGETTVVNQPSDGSSTATTTRSPIWSRAWSMDAAGPGTFTTTVLEPGLVVTVGDGWIPGQAESEATWNARLPQPDRPAAPQAAVYVLQADAESADEVIETATSRGFQLSDPEQVQVGGIAGQRYDS